MNTLNTEFLNIILQKYTTQGCVIHVTDSSSHILASTEAGRIGTLSSTAQYVSRVKRTTTIANGADVTVNDIKGTIFGAPLFFDNEFYGTVIVHGAVENASQQGNAIKIAIETVLEYDSHTNMSVYQNDLISRLAECMLSPNCDSAEIESLMNKLDMDSGLYRSAIYIRMNYLENKYFNVSLNLGYRSGIEQMKEEVITKLKADRFLNSQDITYLYDYNTVVIIKSFIPVSDTSRIYLSLDRICEELSEVCSTFNTFDFTIAYGNVYQGTQEVYKSFCEARETLEFGLRTHKDEKVFILENILFENVCYYLHPQITSKIINSIINKLTKKDGVIAQDIIDCAEAFVDNCMSVSETSKKTFLHRNTINSRLEKLSQLTDLKPTKSLQDAFIIKMTAVYLRQKDDG